MENAYIKKENILKTFEEKMTRWKEIKGEGQDVTYENFIDNVILVYSWVMDDISRMEK